MRKRSWRITPDEATHFHVEDLARKESRPVANMCLHLIKCGLEMKRAEKRAIESDRGDAQ